MMAQGNDKKYLAYAVLEFLDQEFKDPKTIPDQRESLEVAMQCLETAFGINMTHEEYKSEKTLSEVYRDFWKKERPVVSNYEAKPTIPVARAARNDVLLDVKIDIGAPYAVPPDTNMESKLEADKLKNIGNEEMKDGKFEDALDHYTEAIALDGRNSVYFCNRAAAFLKLNMLDKALNDCQVAMQLNPGYARAYGRMGVIYSNMGLHTKAYVCFKRAVDLEPENDSYVNNLRVAQDVIEGEDRDSEPMAEGAAGGSLDAGPQNIQTIFNNPSLINMATQMLQDPSMQNMMRSIITGFHAGGSDTQSVDNLLQMGQAIANQIRTSNPNLAEEIGSRLHNQEPRSSPGGDSYDL